MFWMFFPDHFGVWVLASGCLVAGFPLGVSWGPFWAYFSKQMNVSGPGSLPSRKVVNVLGTAAPTTNDCKIIALTPGNYNLTSFANHLATIISAEFSGIPVSFTVVPNSNTNTLTITPNTANYKFKIRSDYDLKIQLAHSNKPWTGPAYNINNPGDINDIIKNTSGSAGFHTQADPYTTGSIDLQPIKNVYITSPNLGTYKTFSPSNGVTVIKKVSVTADNNQMIFSNVTSSNDYLDCSRQTLRTLTFELQDVHGNIIPLHGSHVSFSLVFDKYPTED